MRVYCKCKNVMTNHCDPNDTEYFVFSENQKNVVINHALPFIDALDIPEPEYTVFRCDKCGRIVIFDDKNSYVATYIEEQ